MTLDDLEFELRKLPGVRAVGFDDRGDVLMVQLHMANDRATTDNHDVPLPVAATRIATRHSDRPVAVEIVRWRDAPPALTDTSNVTPIGPAHTSAIAGPGAGPIGHVEAVAEHETRPRLLAVLSFPDTDELEVHLVLAGRRTIGRAPASGGLVASVQATVEAVRALSATFGPSARWARPVDGTNDTVVLVAVSIDTKRDDTTDSIATSTLYGVASGSSAIDAAARATLDAINRQLEQHLHAETP